MKNRGIRGQAPLWGLALFGAYICSAHAGSFTVNPVRVTLSATQAVAAITVRNVGTEATVVQLETSSWNQHDGQDALASTTEVLATPPIITVPPGASRIIRVGLRRPADPQRELTYRLFLREVPPPEPISQGLRVALLLSIPVFVVPPRIPGPQVQWHAVRMQDGNIRLQAHNTGQSHVQLGQLQIAAAGGGTVIATRNMSEYLLPDNAREWMVTATSAPAVGAPLVISSQADIGRLTAKVTLEDDPRELNPKTPGTAAR
jgi:fimbrial chaperone protein